MYDDDGGKKISFNISWLDIIYKNNERALSSVDYVTFSKLIFIFQNKIIFSD